MVHVSTALTAISFYDKKTDKGRYDGKAASTDFCLYHRSAWPSRIAEGTIPFCTPRGHPKINPFIDRVIRRCYADKRVRFANHVVLERLSVSMI